MEETHHLVCLQIAFCIASVGSIGSLFTPNDPYTMGQKVAITGLLAQITNCHRLIQLQPL